MPNSTPSELRPPGKAIVGDEVVPALEAVVPVLDRGFLWGDGVYEITPCFNGNLFRLEDHLERLHRSLRYVDIDAGLSIDELVARSQRLMDLNSDVLRAYPICRLGHWVSRGLEDWGLIHDRVQPPTLVSFIAPVTRPLGRRVYEHGLEMTIVANRRTSPSSLDPRAKVTSKMNLIVGDLQAGSRGKLALLLDGRGFLAEGSTSNIFLVKSGVILTPRPERVLGGITRQVVLEIAPKLGFEVVERDLSLVDLAVSDEIFVTSSTWGVVPVRSVDQMEPKTSSRPVTYALIEKLAALTGFHPLAGT